MNTKLALALAPLLLCASLAEANTSTFTHLGTGSGQLNGVPFPASDFTIVALVDTANQESFGSGYSIDHTQATITIAGLGTYSFTTPTRTFVNNGVSTVGFSRATIFGSDLFNGPGDPALATWDMLSPIGPISGTGNLLQWGSSPIDTSGGILFFDSATTPSTFTAGAPSPPGNAYCFGDASGANCPCSAFGSVGQGCANSGGVGGATLTGIGNANMTNDSFQLEVAGVPGAKPGLILRGDNQVALPAGDGILCTTGGSMRSHVQITAAGATAFTDFGGAPFGSVANIGAPTNFQFWYRDPQNPCSGAGFNFTNAWTVTYQP